MNSLRRPLLLSKLCAMHQIIHPSACLSNFVFVCLRVCESSFEKTLKQKLSQKASGNANEETVLLKAFKYFDLNNNGTVEPDEFAKAVEKIGIMIPTRQVSSR